MFLVIVLWVVYINLIVEESAPAPIATQTKIENPELAQVFKAGLKIVTGQIGLAGSKVIDYLKKQTTASNLITISSSERNFVLENLEPIPETPLP